MSDDEFLMARSAFIHLLLVDRPSVRMLFEAAWRSGFKVNGLRSPR